MEYSEFLERFFDKGFIKELREAQEKENLHSFRLNPNKIPSESFYNSLEKHPIVKEGYLYDKSLLEAGKHPYHAAGCYYIQEPSAMIVGHLLDVKPNDKIIDLCASPGGKSTHVALKLSNEGFLLSNDYNTQRALNLSENIERLGITNTIVTNETVEKLSLKYQGHFDKVILDAPCSGEGMFRKNENVEKDWSIDKVERLSQLQKELIMQAYALLKNGGEMIYSTCTFNKLEDEEVIQYLLSNTKASLIKIPEYEGIDRGIDMSEAIRIFPHHFKGEGHFICMIKCNDNHEPNYLPKVKGNCDKKTYQLLADFAKQNLNISFDFERIFVSNNNLYYLPKASLPTASIHVVRGGLYLGEVKGNLFIPSHHLALATNQKAWKNSIDFSSSSEEIKKYLKGESFQVNCKNGWALVTVDNCSIGICKVSNNTLKNHYPKRLRIN